MKEDVLEQIVDDYLQHKGYLTRHNIKFKPERTSENFNSRKDAVPSDIDVIGLNPRLKGPDRVWAVSCKSWQAGFYIENTIKQIESNKTFAGKTAEQRYRELLVPRWTQAFCKAILNVTGESEFTCVLAVTSIRGDKDSWEKYERFKKALKGNPIRVICLSDMLQEIYRAQGTTMASSEVGRLLQLIKASAWKS